MMIADCNFIVCC